MKSAVAFHRIKSMRVTGGFLAGLNLSFSDGLNTVIGARGSGKSSLQELIRFALGVPPGRDDKDPLRRRIDSLIKSTLAGGRVELVIETKEGMTYTVSRAADEAPVVLSAEGTPLPAGSLRAQIFHADIYSQNEIESIAEIPHYQIDLLDNFKAPALREARHQMGETIQKLRTNAVQILPLISEKAQLEGELAQLEAVREKLRSLAKGVGDDIEELNRVHTAKALRDREIKALDHAVAQLTDFQTKLASLIGQYGDRSIGFFADDMRTSTNQTITSEAIDVIRSGIATTEEHMGKAIQALSETTTLAHAVRAKLEQVHVQQEMDYRSVVEKQKARQAQSAERANVEKQLNDLSFKSKRIEDLDLTMKRHRKAREHLLGALSEDRDRRFHIRHAIAEMLNRHLLPSIRIRIEQNADQDEYRKLLESSLRGAGLQYQKVAQSLSTSLTPQELGALVHRNDAASLSRRGNINLEQARKVIQALTSAENLMELEIVDMDDLPQIELSDNGVYKNSAELSTGQKCTAVLPILLFDSANPLLIDQPEDNLDNRYVYECVVDTVRKAKRGRQMIFVTHNPNIPVLGDSEQVIVMQSDGRSGVVQKTGTVDECREEIINLLEGGADAFRLRSERYQTASQ